MGLGLTPVDWQNKTADFVNARTYQYRNANLNNGASNTVNQTQTSTSTGNTCTDGNDDGKIGILDAVFHVGKGAVTSLVNGVTGMFTNDKGEFDPLKTLGTVALGAACVAFPAVGLVACGIGIVSGGMKLISGVSNAVNAKTDAEAKDAWEQVGDGALATGLSVAGAKASFSAVAETAGAASEINAMKSAGTWKDATTFEKASALGKDMISSTKNQVETVKAAAGTANEALKIQKLRAKASKIEGAPTEEEMSILRELDVRTSEIGNQDAIKLADGMQARSESIQATKQNITGNIKSAKLPEIKLKNIAGNLKKLQKKPNFASIKSTLSTKAQQVVDFLTTEEGTYAEAVQKFGYENVAQALEVFAGYRMLDETV